MLTVAIVVFALLLHSNAIVSEAGKAKDVKYQIVLAFLTVATRATATEALIHLAVQTVLMEQWE